MPLLQTNALARQDLASRKPSAAFSLASLGRFFSILIASFMLIGEAFADDGKKITAIAAGREHSLALDSYGKVYATGWNGSGAFGLGDTTGRDRFTEVSSLSDKGKIIAIAAKSYKSLAIANDGRVYAAGDNENGELGLGDNTYRHEFAEVSPFSDKGKIIAISAGSWHSIAIANDGKVYATGYNGRGQLGLGDTTDRDEFAEVLSLKNKKIIAIAAGDAHSLALANDGKVYAAGWNDAGQLGLGDSGDGTDRDEFAVVSSLKGKNITAIAAGDKYSLALANDGKVYAAGKNDDGQLGLGDNTDRNRFTEVSSLKGKNITAIAAGGYHSLASTSDGKVYATGRNNDSKLGLGDTTNRNRFTEVSSLKGKNIIAVAAEYLHSFALTSDGKVYATGWNGAGQLGLGDKTDRNVFTEVEF